MSEHKQYSSSVREQDPEREAKEIKVEIHDQGAGQIWLEVKDDDYVEEQGVLLELYEGELRAIVWADPTSEDPTHTIKIEPMSAEFRKEYEKCR